MKTRLATFCLMVLSAVLGLVLFSGGRAPATTPAEAAARRSGGGPRLLESGWPVLGRWIDRPALASVRGEGEWAGMPVDPVERAECATTLDCSEAVACREDRRCGPCLTDSECLFGERCVLDHCV